MVRPLKYYIIIQARKVETVVYRGLEEAALRCAHLKGFFGGDYPACYLSFRTRLAAEEFICWWQYEKEAQ